jgi:hypothetical protein
MQMLAALFDVANNKTPASFPETGGAAIFQFAGTVMVQLVLPSCRFLQTEK